MNLEIVDMPDWKAKVLKIAAWILGYRGENAYVILIDKDLKQMRNND